MIAEQSFRSITRQNMLDEKKDEEQDSPKPDEQDGSDDSSQDEGGDDDKGGEELTPEQIAELKKERDDLKGKVSFLEGRIVKLKGKNAPSKEKVEGTSEELSKVVKRMETVEERIALRDDGYSGEEIALIQKMGGKKALDENPIVKKAIEVHRAEKKSKDASPPSSPKSPVYQKYTQEDLGKMTSEELRKILPHAEV